MQDLLKSIARPTINSFNSLKSIMGKECVAELIFGYHSFIAKRVVNVFSRLSQACCHVPMRHSGSYLGNRRIRRRCQTLTP